PAEVAVRMTVGSLLFHERAARMIQYHARNNKLPGFSEVVDALIEATWKSPHQKGLHGEIQRVVDQVVLTHLMGLAGQERAAPQVRAVASLKLKELKDWINQRIKHVSDKSQKAYLNYALSQIRLYEKDPSRVEITEPLPAPAGAPIGMH
ncbi:peptidase, partial [bacterium]|nr:peptidase [bacterium]